MTLPASGARQEKSLYRVMVVDDSAVIRGIVARWLEADPELEVVGTCANGAQAVKMAAERPCDVIVLDIEMPEMDGLTALPHLIRANPGVQVVMSSTLTRRNADVSLRALAMGAADYLAKPESLRGASAADDFRRELLDKIKVLGASRRRRERGETRPRLPGRLGEAAAQAATAGQAGLALRPMPAEKPHILAIGSSTGGPQALLDVLKAAPWQAQVPIVITQHMPATFTAILAEHIQKVAQRPCAEGVTGQVLEPGRIYVAPGGQHMVLRRAGLNRPVTIELNTDPPENFCRPAVDPLFRSVAQIYGARAFGLVLTGMGADGREGGRAIVAAGGTVAAQDEASSVVWGMPGAVAGAGLCAALWPLARMSGELQRLFGGGGRAS